MQKKLSTGLVSALSAVVLAGASVGVASADNSSAPYQPRHAAGNDSGGCGYSDSSSRYRSPVPRYEQERYAPPAYPRYRPRRSYRRSRSSWGGMPWGGDHRGSSWGFGTDDMPWGNRHGRGRGFSFGSDDFKPWGNNRRGRSRGFNFGSSDFKPW